MSITSSTKITFPGGTLVETSKILFSKKLASDPPEMLIVTEITPFHPVDYSWADQPSDQGVIKINEQNFPVRRCLTAALHSQTGEFLLDQEVKLRKIKRDDPSWFFLVAHIIDDVNADLVGQEAVLEVDADYRKALSQSHTASHFVALALNKATADFWKKPADRLDALGNPNLDGEAILEAKIGETESVDRYHCGKSLRKKGFDVARFFAEAEFKQIEAKINQQLSDWLSDAAALKISMLPQAPLLHEKREWSCVFPDGKKAVIPCGGTHCLAIPPQTKIIAVLKREGEEDFVITSKLI